LANRELARKLGSEAPDGEIEMSYCKTRHRAYSNSISIVVKILAGSALTFRVIALLFIHCNNSNHSSEQAPKEQATFQHGVASQRH
jgi:hypothetical protein